MKTETKKQIQNRLNRISGQLQGLQRMVESDVYCVDIITQSSAIKQALSGVEHLLLEHHLSTHVVEQIKKGQEKKAVEEIIKVYALKRK